MTYVKIRSLKEELEAAKKANEHLEGRLKNKKAEVDRLKQDLNKTMHENDIFKRVVYDSKMDMSTDQKQEAGRMKESLSPTGIKRDNRKRKNTDMLDDSFCSNEWDRVDAEMQTDTLRKRDRFIQTEKHGILDLEKVVSLAMLNTPAMQRKLSNKTMVGFNLLEKGKSDGERKYSQNDSYDSAILGERKSEKVKKRSDFNAIEHVIDSQSESISESTQKLDPRQFEDVSKIIVSPLEKMSTYKTNEFVRINSITSRKVETPRVEFKKLSKSPNNSETHARAGTSQFYKKPNIEKLSLQGEQMQQLKVFERFRRNMTSREKDFVSTLMSDRPSRRTSTEDARNTMTAVYESGKFTH